MRSALLVVFLTGCGTVPEGVSRTQFHEDRMDCYLIAVDAYHPTWRSHRYDPRVFKKERECMDQRGYVGVETLSENAGFTRGPQPFERTGN